MLQSPTLTDSRQLTTNNHLAHRNIPITIIGGGIHGISIAMRLLRDNPNAARHIAIVDRYAHPLTEWRHKTEKQGMTFLRSPAVHHITPDVLGVVDYAKEHNRSDELAPPYSQPSTALFWDYCNDALAVSGLQIPPTGHGIYYQFEVAKLRWDKGSGKYPFRLISTNNKGFRSRCVILAIGSDDCAYVPPEFTDWQRRFPDKIVHASQFSVNRTQNINDGERIVIVGGGLTAGTLAKSLSEQRHHVVLIARKQLKTEQFDFPPIWLGPKALAEFANEPNFQKRYRIIQENRGEGSITPDVMETLKRSNNVKTYSETYIRDIVWTQGLQVETTQGLISDVSRIILATGYRFNLRRYSFLRELFQQYPIPLVCGLPKLDANLQFYPIENLFGSGTVAQLQIGPAAGNIAGANLAYERFREKILKHLPHTIRAYVDT